MSDATTTAIPRPEYPRPQFVRTSEDGAPDWVCLNGEWDFDFDHGDSGFERGLHEAGAPALSGRITVPFCPESELSGVGYTDFMNAVWYRRVVSLPEKWEGRRVLLHFQAVDYDATVWVNGVEVGRHRGGFSPFTCDLSGVATGGEEVTITVRARDYNRVAQPKGKQSTRYAPHSCFYTRTTGIWQTVWLEAVSTRSALKRPRITPDVGNGMFRVEVPLYGNTPGLTVRARLSDSQGTVAEASVRADLDFAPQLFLMIPKDRQRVWKIGDPHLYDLALELVDDSGAVVDRVASYAGLRSVALDGRKVKINGEVIFQRLVLDQGYYPDGVMTAPSDEALVRDIQLSLEAGFNGARLHQKVFEERFLYHCDRMGYIVWGEFGDWGCSGYGPFHDHQQPGVTYAAQWLEVLERDYSHPSIVGWCPLNETAQQWHDRITTLDDATRAMFLACKAMDTTRPALDTSGYSHRVLESDIYDSHDYIYEKDFTEGLANFTKRHSNQPENTFFLNAGGGASATNPVIWSVPYKGQPYFVSEFGGFRWVSEMTPNSAADNQGARKTSWGYGQDPTTLEEFYERFQATCDILLDNPEMFGYCYTQLTDVYPEENGIYTFGRGLKFDNARLHQIQTRQAAIEKL